MLSTFLDQRLPQSNDSVKNMIEYTLESPSVNWKSGKQKNNDSGIYTMVSMLYFDGADVFDCNVLKTVISSHFFYLAFNFYYINYFLHGI